jgi:hypothetical protein
MASAGRRVVLAICVSIVLTVSATWTHRSDAHHAITANFDPTRTAELQGVVVDFRFRSPHSYLIVEGVGVVDGVRQSETPVRWQVESHSVPGMRNLGIDQDTFRPGDTISINGFPSRRNAAGAMLGMTFVGADGARYAGEEQAQGTVAVTGEGVQRLSGRWRSPGYINGPDTPLPLNSAGRAAWQNYDPILSPAANCETQSIPGVFSAPYLSELRVGADSVFIRNEAYDVRRTIPLSDTYASVNPNGSFGQARARIEGDTLIIESRAYPPSGWGLGIATHVNGGGADIPSSDQKTVIERYSVSADGQTLTLAYTLADPTFLSGPYDGRFELNRVSPDTPIYDYVCDLQSASEFARDP